MIDDLGPESRIMLPPRDPESIPVPKPPPSAGERARTAARKGRLVFGMVVNAAAAAFFVFVAIVGGIDSAREGDMFGAVGGGAFFLVLAGCFLLICRAGYRRMRAS